MKKIRIFIATVITTFVLLLSPALLAQPPFPALTIDNATKQNPLQVQCGFLGSFSIPTGNPAHIHWPLFWFTFFAPSGVCNVLVGGQPQASFAVAIALDGSQGAVTGINPVNNFIFVQGQLNVSATNVEIQIHGF